MINKQLKPSEQLTVERYLERYAETMVHHLDDVSIDIFETVIVVPIYDEDEVQLLHFLEYQKQSKIKTSTLFVWVFNAPESAINTPSLKRTQLVLKSCLVKMQACKLAKGLYFSRFNEHVQVLFVDRCHNSLIPNKQGVGLARKLGMDIALMLTYKQYLSANRWCHWIYSTDADAILPERYGLIPPKNNVAACVYPFKHIPVATYERAMLEYEFSLHYYVELLKSAGSPYAFHTIGSLIAVSSICYAQVRGMPKRAGAEDFYLLNKLAKLGEINSLEEPFIELSGRPSHRVPFGTGPALVKIRNQYKNNDAFHVYNPQNFLLLAYVLKSVSEIEHSSAEDDILLSILSVKLTDQLELEAVSEILIDLGWKKQLTHLKQLKSTDAIQHAFHVWFDGFITLRFIHELRDRLYPNILLTELPNKLVSILLAELMQGNDFDYTAWFKTLGI